MRERLAAIAEYVEDVLLGLSVVGVLYLVYICWQAHKVSQEYAKRGRR